MPRFCLLNVSWCAVLLWCWPIAQSHVLSEEVVTEELPSTEQVDPAHAKFFADEVLPILKASCFKCHGEKAKVEAGLRLTHRDSILTGGDSGAAVDLAEPAESLLLSAVNYVDYEMPPKGKLPPEQIAILRRWVEMGIPFPDGLVKHIDHVEEHGPPAVNDENRSFWSFQKVQRPEVPSVNDPSWVKTPIDAFILAKLEAEGLQPNGPADKVTLLRRVTYDLTGLPPSPEDVRAFLADNGEEAYERLIDRLLDSPHYGEKWGRHWLDLVRYAETNSYERDAAKPEVWRYRDYVIRAFNEDKPYDQFVREQLAGDEFPEPTVDSIVATGYYRLGRWDDEPVDGELAWYDDMDDVLATTSQVFLGLTMNCARCHDHKLDPIPQDDYYRFLSFFAGVTRQGGPGRNRDVNRWSLTSLDSPALKSQHAAELAAYQAKTKELQGRIADLESLIVENLSNPEQEDWQYDSSRVNIFKRFVGKEVSQKQYQDYQRLRRALSQLQRSPPGTLGKALCVKESGPNPQSIHLLIRGNHRAKDKEVKPGFPQILGYNDPVIPEPSKGANTSRRRTVLADWITRADNPLTARVFVNRLWQFHFGRGIVSSPHNFGLQGRPPTHPELLDWLAADFVAEGWRVKRLHKMILMSSTYRQSSQARPAALAKDPENNLFWRFNMRRLTAEEIRDSILAVNGTLLLRVGGPSVYPVIPREVLAGQSRPGNGWPLSPPDKRDRRSVYIHLKRSLLVPIMENHDQADLDATCAVRFNTTVPSQALGFLNSEFIREQASEFAASIKREAADDLAGQVAVALRRVTQREPNKDEVRHGVELVKSLHDEHSLSHDDALKYFCLVALNLNEFVYLD